MPGYIRAPAVRPMATWHTRASTASHFPGQSPGDGTECLAAPTLTVTGVTRYHGLFTAPDPLDPPAWEDETYPQLPAQWRQGGLAHWPLQQR